MHKTTKAVLAANSGRDPVRLAMKLAALRSDPFAFLRGTCPLFFATLPLGRALLASPTVLTCGDLHLENFGSFKGDNRLVYFDLVDFDEACLAPVACDLARVLTSVLVAAGPLKIRQATATKLVAHFIDTWAANVAAGKPRWIERALAGGPVKKLLQSVKNRHRADLIAERTRGRPGKTTLLIDDKKTIAIQPRDRHRAESILAAYASTQPAPSFYTPIDIAHRIAGNGSLGLERYVALVRGDGGDAGRYLIDIKVAQPSALAAAIRTPQPRWRSEAERVLAIQRTMQAISPALLGAVGIGKRSYLIKELHPSADRVNLAALNGRSGKLHEVIGAMAEACAWAHLRGCGRYGADSVDALATFALGVQWRESLTACAIAGAALTLRQWQAYSMDYDADAGKLADKLPHR